jgi:hypothetical protein
VGGIQCSWRCDVIALRRLPSARPERDPPRRCLSDWDKSGSGCLGSSKALLPGLHGLDFRIVRIPSVAGYSTEHPSSEEAGLKL